MQKKNSTHFLKLQLALQYIFTLASRVPLFHCQTQTKKASAKEFRGHILTETSEGELLSQDELPPEGYCKTKYLSEKDCSREDGCRKWPCNLSAWKVSSGSGTASVMCLLNAPPASAPIIILTLRTVCPSDLNTRAKLCFLSNMMQRTVFEGYSMRGRAQETRETSPGPARQNCSTR